MNSNYEFSNSWFAAHWNNWVTATQSLKVEKILEIGSFEGRSSCTMIDYFGSKNDLCLFSIDTWQGGVEHASIEMSAVEELFDKNTAIAVKNSLFKIETHKLKGPSVVQLSKLICEGHSNSFDLIFIDGSHQSADVLTDCVLSYQLCKLGGFIFCDDYLWSMEKEGQENLFNMPKLGIDAFSLAFTRKVKQIPLHLYQAYFRKIG